MRVETRCTPGPDTSGDRPDSPGSLRLFVAPFAESRLLGLAFELNKRSWGSTPFEKASELLRKSYGRPTVSTPVTREVTKTPQIQLVTAATSWQWEDSTVRLLVRGIGNNMPGTDIPGIGNPGGPSYSYSSTRSAWTSAGWPTSGSPRRARRTRSGTRMGRWARQYREPLPM